MKPYQERVVQEKKDLDEKITALKSFVNGDDMHGVEEDEQQRLIDQLDAMEIYTGVLEERIANFKD